MSKYQVNDHSVLKVTKEEAKQGSSWHDLAKRREHQQHGDGEDIPEGDIHAVQKHYQHAGIPQRAPEEVKATLDSLEEKIKQLQANEVKPQAPTPAQNPQQDDPLDDWYKE
ncbi:MAG: hypothetical protein H0W89_04550 [Candidatus Levybacteria bacterium]|nr:hypothetical protein [Candidatus Levybacteria bacterium]